jgi:hypothetical protein
MRQEIFMCPPGAEQRALTEMGSTEGGEERTGYSFGPDGKVPFTFRTLGPAAHAAMKEYGCLSARRFGIDELDLLGQHLGVDAPDWGDAVEADGAMLVPFPPSFVAALAGMDAAAATTHVLTSTGFVPPTPPSGMDVASLPPDVQASFSPDAGWGAFYADLKALAARADSRGWRLWQALFV